MSEWVNQNISWVLPFILAVSGIIHRIVSTQLENRIMANVRRGDHEIHERIDKIEDIAKENAVLRREDQKRQDRLENIIDEIRHDVKTLLRKGGE